MCIMKFSQIYLENLIARKMNFPIPVTWNLLYVEKKFGKSLCTLGILNNLPISNVWLLVSGHCIWNLTSFRGKPTAQAKSSRFQTNLVPKTNLLFKNIYNKYIEDKRVRKRKQWDKRRKQSEIYEFHAQKWVKFFLIGKRK